MARRFRIYRCPVDGHLYAEVEDMAAHPGVSAVRYYSNNASTESGRTFWRNILNEMERADANQQS